MTPSRSSGRNMANSVRTGSQALIQLDISLGYIKDTLDAPRAANKLLKDIHAAADSLKTFPRNNPLHNGLSAELGVEVRWKRFGNYHLYFAIDDDTATVYVFSISRASQDGAWRAVRDFFARN